MKNLFLLILFILIFCGYPLVSFADDLIVYSCLTGRYWQIWISNLTTGTHHQLTTTPSDKKYPVWSPKGDKLIYRTGNGELFQLDIDNKKEEKILSAIQYCADPQWLTQDEILITRYRTDIIDDSDIWLINLKTGEKKVLVSEPSLQYQPVMSKDLKKLVYVSAIKPGNHQIFCKDLTTGKVEKLTQAQAYNFMPSISPDEKKIVFASNLNGDNELYLVDIHTHSQIQLTKRPGIDTYPRWFNNSTIIYVSYQDGKFQINQLDIKTLESKPLIVKDTDCVDPDWIKK